MHIFEHGGKGEAVVHQQALVAVYHVFAGASREPKGQPGFFCLSLIPGRDYVG